MKLWKALICLTFGPIWIIKGQLLLNPYEIFEKFPIFDENFIRQRRIKQIIFDIIDKKDWQAAEDKDLTEVYEFLSNGKLKRQYHTSIRKVLRYETHIQHKKQERITTTEHYEYDTLSVEYIYEPSLIIERHHYPNNYTEATYRRYCGAYVCKEEKYIETYRPISSEKKVLDKLFLKAQDSIQTYNFDHQIKQIYYNNEKLPYKEKFIYFNKQHQITEILEQFMVANSRLKKVFNYNDYGNIENAVMTIDFGTQELYRITYTYDDKNRLFSEKHYKNQEEIKEYQYIYNENSFELKSILIRTYETKNIRIIKLNYTYYEQ